jgi:hypothetical protein
MGDGLDWLYRPAGAGLCRVESLLDGTLDLVHVAEMNDFLDVQEENQRRVDTALRRG